MVQHVLIQKHVEVAMIENCVCLFLEIPSNNYQVRDDIQNGKTQNVGIADVQIVQEAYENETTVKTLLFVIDVSVRIVVKVSKIHLCVEMSKQYSRR